MKGYRLDIVRDDNFAQSDSISRVSSMMVSIYARVDAYSPPEENVGFVQSTLRRFKLVKVEEEQNPFNLIARVEQSDRSLSEREKLINFYDVICRCEGGNYRGVSGFSVHLVIAHLEHFLNDPTVPENSKTDSHKRNYEYLLAMKQAGRKQFFEPASS